MSIVMCKLSEYFSSYNETESFCKWAFGTTRLILKEVPSAWNDHHGNKLMLSPSDDISKSIHQMTQLWKEEKKVLKERSKIMARIRRETGFTLKDNPKHTCGEAFCKRC